jgi:GNAT superfamily N-acetyltransferase
MDPDRQKAVADDLPHLHARPTGGILIGSVKGQDVGCVMYNAAPQSGTAVFNRMFVNEAGRGHGVGGKMLDAMFKQMVEDGYGKVRFSSATFLTHARKMYEAAGFTSIPQPEGIPEVWRDRVYFMERDLT